MKKINIIAASAALIFAFGCTEEALNPQQDGQNQGDQVFSIKASVAPSTRTSFDASTLEVEWSEGDALGIYIIGGETDQLYKFTKAEGEDIFSSAEFVPVPETEYTYYVFYPYSESVDGLETQVTIDSGIYSSADPDGNIDTPLWGIASATGTEEPAVKLEHLASVIEVKLDNQTGSDLTVEKISLDASAGAALSGAFVLNLETGDLAPVEGAVSASASLEVNAPTASAYYIACAPYSGDLTVNIATDKTYSVTKKDVVFKAGEVRPTTVTVDGEPELPETIISLSIEGPAAGAEPIEILPALENENIYAWYGELQAGEFKIMVNGSDAYLAVSDVTLNGDAYYYSISFDGGSYTVPESGAGKHRIIVNTEAGTVQVYDAETDEQVFKPKTVIYKKTHPADEADDNFSQQVDILYLWSGNTYNTGSRPVGGEFVLTQSLANPRLFVYKGSTLKAGENLKFLVSDARNNVYAFGAGDTGSNGSDMYVNVEIGTKFEPIYGGQGNNRYTYFVIPENTNYIELYVGEDLQQELEDGNALNHAYALPDSYVLFDQR